MVCAAALNSVFVPIFLYVPDNTGQKKLQWDELTAFKKKTQNEGLENESFGGGPPGGELAMGSCLT